jgi:hypothetical protein
VLGLVGTWLEDLCSKNYYNINWNYFEHIQEQTNILLKMLIETIGTTYKHEC